MLKVVTKVI